MLDSTVSHREVIQDVVNIGVERLGFGPTDGQPGLVRF